MLNEAGTYPITDDCKILKITCKAQRPAFRQSRSRLAAGMSNNSAAASMPTLCHWNHSTRLRFQFRATHFQLDGVRTVCRSRSINGEKWMQWPSAKPILTGFTVCRMYGPPHARARRSSFSAYARLQCSQSAERVDHFSTSRTRIFHYFGLESRMVAATS